MSCLKVICWALIIYTHYRCIRFDIIICIIFSIYYKKLSYWTGGNYDVFSIYYKKLSYWTGGCFSIRLRRFVCRLRRISTSTSTNFNSTSTNFNSTSTNFNSTSTNFNSTSTNFNSTSTNLYSTLTIFSQLRRIWIETDIWTYENDICVVEMICRCS